LPRGWFGRGFWFGWGRGFGNPYPFCRWFPWLPRWWWAYPALSLPYYRASFGIPYPVGYPLRFYMMPNIYSPYGLY